MSESIKILYVDNIEKFDYNFLPIYKKSDNGKYFQLCISSLGEDVLKENADPTDLIFAIEGFSISTFNAISKKMNVKFVNDKEKEVIEEKVIIIKKYIKYNKYE